MRTHCKPFKYRAIKGITQDDVASLYKKISRNAGPGAASHTWSTLRAFMHWCMGRGVLEKNVAALYDGGGTTNRASARSMIPRSPSCGRHAVTTSSAAS